jgi:AcrR family transcriptional regulator
MNTKEKHSVNKIMETARTLFLRFGLRKVSVEEICREAGVSKMSFYRNFKDKDEIAAKVLVKYFTERMETFELILKENILFEERLKKIVSIKMEGFRNAGDEIIKDILSDRESEAGKALGNLIEEQTSRTRKIFEDLQKKGDIRKDIRVELIIHLVEGIWKSFSDEKLLELYPDKSQLYQEFFKAVYYGLLPEQQTKIRRRL